MLLRFGVSNFLSFSERQEISLIASSLSGNDACIQQVPGSKWRALPLAAVYGANASGKSNLVAALKFLANAIDQSHRASSPEAKIPRFAFALGPEGVDAPSAFDVDFVVDGVRYHYGFECTDRAFVSEWLYAYPQGTRRKLYERTSESQISFGSTLRGPKSILKTFMRPNSLFLSAAAQNNHDELGKIAAFFSSIQFNGEIAVEPPAIFFEFSTKDIDARAIDLLERLGTGVVGVSKHKKPLSDKQTQLKKGLMDLITQISGRELPIGPEDEEDTVVTLLHRTSDGRDVPFDLARESSGTRRLLVLITSVLSAMDKGTPVVIDELDASLHTNAAEVLMAMFSDPTINTNGSQLIATTHDTNLMTAVALRRDEIWFVEKNSVGESSVFPLSEFQTRANDNIERGYIQGRFGAIPFSGLVSDWLRGSSIAEHSKS